MRFLFPRLLGPTNGYGRVKTLTDAFSGLQLRLAYLRYGREKKSIQGVQFFYLTEEFLTSTALVSCGMRYESVRLPVPSGEIKLLDAVDADGTS